MTPDPTPPGLYDQPVLVLDPGVHTAEIKRADVDAAGVIAVTGSYDRTVRVWSVADGRLIHTIRLPQGPGEVGKVYAVAISPDGATIAAGGWTRWTEADPQEQIYLFDARSGKMLQRIEGLPDVAHHLAFSPDGRRLAATLGGGHGLRLHEVESRWAACDPDYVKDSYGSAFAPDGRLATTSLDGSLRLYGPDGALLRTVESGGAEPFGLAFDREGARLAVGFYGAPAVRLFDGRSLEALPPPDTAGLDNGTLSQVAWSADGATLFAAGRYYEAGTCPVVAWDGAGSGPRRVIAAGRGTTVSLRPLPGGDLLVAAADPWLARLAPDGAPRWSHSPRQMDASGQLHSLGLGRDGMVVDFGMERTGGTRARFELAALALGIDPPDDGRTAAPPQHTAISGWEGGTALRLNGVPLPLEPRERTRCLAMHPDGARFVLGTSWSLRAFAKTGAELWRQGVPGIAWAVNISGDGRLALAAHSDGTLRWRRMEDGAELLALFPMIDRENWVAWTPEGVYAATTAARSVLRWHVNHGWDAAGRAIPVSDIPETHRPDVIRHILPQLGFDGAVAVAERIRIRNAVQRATGSEVAPGARLHVLAIGVSKHGVNGAHLDLDFADQDARDVAAALFRSQKGYYADVKVTRLLNSEAGKDAIFAALAAMRAAMSAGGGADLALIHFAGHGVLVDDALYLLPHAVDARTSAGLKATALPVGQFRDEVSRIAVHGRVLVFLDACRSGAAAADGVGFALDARALRGLLAMSNVSVFTSSQATETSIESPDWKNGAFTEALLEALGQADQNGDGLIEVGDLASFLDWRVPQLTGGRQQPGVWSGFPGRILAASL